VDHNADRGTLSNWLALADRLAKPVENTANFCAGLAIFVLMVLGSAQIFLRTLLNYPIDGYIDVVQLSMATMAFLGAAYCQRLGAHIRMEILLGFLRGRALWAFEIVGLLAGLFIIAVLMVYGWDHFMRAYQLGDTTIDAEIITWPSKLLVPFAFAIWFVRMLIQLAGSVRLFIDPSAEQIGVARLLDVSEVAEDEIKDTFGDTLTDDLPLDDGGVKS